MNNRKNSLTALLITTLLMICLLAAGGFFVLPAIQVRMMDQPPAEDREKREGEEESLATWLGLDTVRTILSQGDPARSATETSSGTGTKKAASSATADRTEAAPSASASKGKAETTPAASVSKEKTEPAPAASASKEKTEATPTASASKEKDATADESAKDKSEKADSDKVNSQTADSEKSKSGTDEDEKAGKSEETKKAEKTEKAEEAEKAETTEKSKESEKTGKTKKAENSKEADPEKKDPQDSMTKLQKKYVQAWEDFHGRAFPLNAALHNYNWKYLQYDELGRLHYDGDKHYSVRHGIDVSEFQGRIDWEKVRKSGIDFVFVRAGHRMFESGVLMKDTRAVKNLTRAKKAGLEVGVYVFSQAVTEEEAREEAQLCLDVIRESDVEVTLPVVFDPEIQIEYYARINFIDGEQFTDNTLAFCKAIKKAGYAPAVYANCSTETDILDMSRLDGQAAVWYADYNSIPESPYQFTFWQYSNTGLVEGIPEAETDLNVWFVEKQ